MPFTGFGPELFEFFAGLEADNSKSYWEAHRDTYESSVRAPMLALAEELETRIGSVHIFRPYRDLRFSKDKRPYQEHASLSVDDGRGGGLYVAVSVEGMHLGGGYWHPSKDRIERWRSAVDDDETGSHLGQLLGRLSRHGFNMGYAPTLKRVPSGYRRDHPREELMRRTDFTIGARYPDGEELRGPKALTLILNGWKRIQQWQGWLAEHVGPAENESPGERPR